ncbi:MAG TPA: three-Cys-motif partner protein TcmP [Vicinamibacterales bacterium]|nr:three-Cys-motif partner protein TcmP [Vicinamibacterales bacterium]
MAKSLKLDEIGYWSEVKLDIVCDYAREYSKIVANQPVIREHIYVDAFAGAGSHTSKTSGEMVPGSPLNAISIEPPFSSLHFIDLNKTRVAELERLSAADPRVTVHHGDCNEILLRDVFPQCRFKDFRRGLCLLDPYALNVSWEVLATAGQMGSVEVFYNLMIMDANMNVFKRDPSSVTPAQAARMTAVWGDDSWRSVAYREETDLFGPQLEKTDNPEIAEAFRLRLKKVAGFKYVPPPIPMRNSKGATVYYLYFASPNKIGGKIVDHIFDKYRTWGLR